jgi:hypothetical protein
MFANVDLLLFGMCIILVEEPIPNNNTKGNWHVMQNIYFQAQEFLFTLNN